MPRKQKSTVKVADELLVTPDGLRPKSLVRMIEPGHFLDGTKGHLRKLHPSGKALADFGSVPRRPGNKPLMSENVAGGPGKCLHWAAVGLFMLTGTIPAPSRV